MAKSEILAPIIIVVFFVGAIFVVQWGTGKQRIKREVLMQKGGITIGSYNYKTGSGRPTDPSISVSFSYNIDGKQYKGWDSRFYLDRNNSRSNVRDAKKGDLFLVLYDKKAPKNAIIHFDYPIKDSTDFNRYVEEIERTRKEKRWDDNRGSVSN